MLGQQQNRSMSEIPGQNGHALPDLRSPVWANSSHGTHPELEATVGGERHRCCVNAVITLQNEAASAGSELRRRFSRHKLTGRKSKVACQFPPTVWPSAREL